MNVQNDAIKRVRASERRYNIAKLILVVGSIVGLFVFIGFEADKSINDVKRDNDRTRLLICDIVKQSHIPAQDCE